MHQAHPSPASTPSQPIDIVCSRYFTEWLHKEQFSIAFTTYQTHRLFLLGLKPDTGRLSAFERLFDRAMGLTVASPDRLYMSERYRLWQLDNALAPGETYNEYDKLYVPRVGHITGELDVHDLAVDADGRLIFVNTLYAFFMVFGMLDVVTQGGPGQTTEFLVYKIYRDGFARLREGQASAQSVFLFLMVASIAGFQIWTSTRRAVYSR